jgi:hypothetical protein
VSIKPIEKDAFVTEETHACVLAAKVSQLSKPNVEATRQN